MTMLCIKNKKHKSVVASLVLCVLLLVPMNVLAKEVNIDEFGISFELSDDMTLTNEIIEEPVHRYIYQGDAEDTLIISIMDLYDETKELMVENDLIWFRADLDFDILDDETIKKHIPEEFDVVETKKVEVNGIKYWRYRGSFDGAKTQYILLEDGSVKETGIAVPEINITMIDGYLIMFFHYNHYSTEHYKMLESIDYSGLEWVNLAPVILIISVLAVIVITFIIIKQLRKKSKKKSQEIYGSMTYNEQQFPKECYDEVEKIKQYKKLYDAGIITEEEFNEKKKRLMQL